MSLAHNHEADSAPWLSVLIPAYEHPVGVARILDRLYIGDCAGVECLIGDDSHSDAVENAVRAHPLFVGNKVVYRRNTPAFGAVANWNDLIGRARGDYVLLMHHDECPERDDFAVALLQELNNGFPDLLILQCLVPTRSGRCLRPHVPLLLRRLLLAFGPDHLLRHNTVGAPSAVVVRRSRCLLFNPLLKWLVDVDWMVRLLRAPGTQTVITSSLAVVSLPNATTSITASLDGQIPELIKAEARIIRNQSAPSMVFTLLLPSSGYQYALSYLENMAWLTLRALTKSVGWICGRSLPSWLQGEA